MKVLHITNNFPSEKFPIFGIFVKEQIDSLSRIGINNTIFFINGREKGRIEYLKSIFRLRLYLKYNNFDIIHCHHALSALCLILSGHTKKNKLIVSFQNDPVHEFGLLLYRFIIDKINYRIFKNNSKLIKDNNSFYLPNGVNLNFFKPLEFSSSCRLLNLNPTKKYILFVSSNFIRKQKRYDRFQEVIQILKNKYMMKNLQELLLINTRREFIPYYFNVASLHLVTSDYEGSPNSVKESMACNTPVVSTNIGNVKEMISGATNCYVSETFEANELAFLCNRALKTNGNIRELIIKKKLDIESIAERLENIYLKILND